MKFKYFEVHDRRSYQRLSSFFFFLIFSFYSSWKGMESNCEGQTLQN